MVSPRRLPRLIWSSDEYLVLALSPAYAAQSELAPDARPTRPHAATPTAATSTVNEAANQRERMMGMFRVSGGPREVYSAGPPGTRSEITRLNVDSKSSVKTREQRRRRSRTQYQS